MNRIHIIHPLDTSTSFLEEISFFLKKSFPDHVNILRLNKGAKAKNECLDFINDQNEDSNFFFFGHGASYCLYGVPETSSTFDILINKNNLSIFDNKNLYCLSCESSDFLKKERKNNHLKSCIGYGYIPSEYDEIIAIREGDANFLTGISEEDIKIFLSYLISIHKHSIKDFISQNLSFYELYNLIRLRINKSISSIILKDKQGYNRQAVSELYKLKNESYFHFK